MAGDNGGAFPDVRAVDRVGVIADVNEIEAGGQLSLQRAREKKKFVDVAEPLRDEGTSEPDATEEGLRMDQLGRHARGGKAPKHHHRETLHALLLIGRVVTDQKDHGQGESD